MNRFSPMAPDSYLFSGGGFFWRGVGGICVGFARCQVPVECVPACCLSASRPPKGTLVAVWLTQCE